MFGRAGQMIPMVLSLVVANALIAQPAKDSTRLSAERSGLQGRKPILPPTRSAPIPAPVSAPVGGYEIVTGPMLEMAPLTISVATAQCPVDALSICRVEVPFPSVYC